METDKFAVFINRATRLYPNGVSHTLQELCDTPISVCRIPQGQRLHFIPENCLRRVLLGLIIEIAPGETECFTYLSHGILSPQCFNHFSLLRQVWFNQVEAFFECRVPRSTTPRAAQGGRSARRPPRWSAYLWWN